MTQGTPHPVTSATGAQQGGQQSHPPQPRAAPGGCSGEGSALGCVPAESPRSRWQRRGAAPAPLEPWLGAVHWEPAGLDTSVLKKTLPQTGSGQPCQGRKGQRAVTWGPAPHAPGDSCGPGGGPGKAPSIPTSRGKRQWTTTVTRFLAGKLFEE